MVGHPILNFFLFIFDVDSDSEIKIKIFFFLRKNIFFFSAQIAQIGLKIVSIVMKSKVTPEKVVGDASHPTSGPHSIRQEDGRTSTPGCGTYFFEFSKVCLVNS